MRLCKAFNTYLHGIHVDIGNISRLLLPLTFKCEVLLVEGTKDIGDLSMEFHIILLIILGWPKSSSRFLYIEFYVYSVRCYRKT